MVKRIFQILGDLGPLLAGIQIAMTVVGFFGIGAIADWILTNWFPFTRWIWDELFSFVNLPNISAAEKDALTTVVFFLPLSITAILHRFSTTYVVGAADLMDREFRQRIYAAIVGAIFIYIMGGAVIRDAIEAFALFVEGLKSNSTEIIAEDSQRSLFEEIGIWTVGIVLITTVSITYAYLRFKSRNASETEQKLNQEYDTHDQEQRSADFSKMVIRQLTSIAAAASTALVNVAAVGSLTGAFLAVGSLGPIRIAAIVLVLSSLIVSVRYQPKRLLTTAGVVLALVITSIVWDIGTYIVQIIENAPKETPS